MIYICIPTHNEQQTVGVVLWKLRQVLTEFPRDYQLLVADDASTDKTPDVLEPYTRVLPLTVIRSEQRQGHGASLEMLLREAVRRSEYPKRDIIVVLEADFSDEPDDLVPLIKRLEAGADVAVGNKVGTSKDTRARRFARGLSDFFARRQKWPEGVDSPFDGYRAYRLHAVKRALEDRPGQRLVRYDGWAGHAELLRAVLPHARRVDAVSVEDRPDRLQRPRRERPFASAFQVRAMISGADPAGLIGVAELDRVATASTRRERASVTTQSLNGRDASGHGNGARARRPEGSGEGRSRSRNGTDRGRPEARSNGEGRRSGRDGSRRPVAESGESAARARRSDQGDGLQRQRSRPDAPGERPQRPRRSAPEAGPAAGPPTDDLTVTAELPEASGGIAPVAGEGRPRRKRRRRRKSRQDGAPQPGGETQQAEAAADAGAEVGSGLMESDGAAGGTESGEAAVAGEGTERKRRRRGGRRGGRGRRRPQADEVGGEPGMQEASAADASTHEVSAGGAATPGASLGVEPGAASGGPGSRVPTAGPADIGAGSAGSTGRGDGSQDD